MSNLKYFLEIEKNNGKVFVCGDIHGEYDQFMEHLRNIDFNFDEDLMICTGDLVDRGKKSLDCFNLIYKDWFISCRGNHEQFCHDAFYNENVIRHHISNGGLWFESLPDDVRKVIADRVEEMPYAITLLRNGKKYGFVHADIHPDVTSWNIVKDNILNDGLSAYKELCIWGRSRVRASMKTRWSNHDENIINDVDEVFIGHTVIHERKKVGNINFIDTGLVYDSYNKLTIIEL